MILLADMNPEADVHFWDGDRPPEQDDDFHPCRAWEGHIVPAHIVRNSLWISGKGLNISINAEKASVIILK